MGHLEVGQDLGLYFLDLSFPLIKWDSEPFSSCRGYNVGETPEARRAGQSLGHISLAGLAQGLAPGPQLRLQPW